MANSVFECPHRVTYANCTDGNHVYYGRYLDILEEARGEFFRSLGKTFKSWQEEGFIFPVIECQLKYLQAARYDDALVTRIKIGQNGPLRLVFLCEVMRGESTLLKASTLHVCTDLNGKPRRLPPPLRDLLAPFQSEPGAL